MMGAPSAVRVLWDAAVPAELRAVVEAPLDAALVAAPAWCAELTVRWNDNLTTAYATMTTQPEYRLACLVLGPGLLSLTPPERAEVLQHEVLHIVVQPLVNVSDALLDALPDTPEPLKRWAREQVRVAMEGAVCDLTALVCGLRGQQRPARSPFVPNAYKP